MQINFDKEKLKFHQEIQNLKDKLIQKDKSISQI
jgi:hypothetical protein